MNAAAKRLGVSLRQTEDQLMSNMVLSSAARINCVGGVNGKTNRIAVVKSSLIDLDLCNADNKAEGNCHGERLSEKTSFVGRCDSLSTLAIA